MNSSLIVLVVVFALLAFLLLVLCLWTRWANWVKLGMVLLVSLFYFQAFDAVKGSLGWPAADALPKRFILLAVVFDEPNKERGSKGQIYIWVNAMEDRRPAAEPRAYRLPYEKDLHSLLGEAMKKNREGVTQVGTAEPKVGPKGFSWLRPPGDDKVSLKFSDLPRPQLPEK